MRRVRDLTEWWFIVPSDTTSGVIFGRCLPMADGSNERTAARDARRAAQRAAALAAADAKKCVETEPSKKLVSFEAFLGVAAGLLMGLLPVTPIFYVIFSFFFLG